MAKDAQLNPRPRVNIGHSVAQCCCPSYSSPVYSATNWRRISRASLLRTGSTRIVQAPFQSPAFRRGFSNNTNVEDEETRNYGEGLALHLTPGVLEGRDGSRAGVPLTWAIKVPVSTYALSRGQNESHDFREPRMYILVTGGVRGFPGSGVVEERVRC